MADFRGGQTIFNQAQFQMIRLHELMTTVNEAWVNFGGFVDDIPAHQTLFNVLQAYYLEVESTFTSKESEEVKKLLLEVEELISTRSLWTFTYSQGLSGTKKTKVMHYQTYFFMRKKLRQFQMAILQNAQKHGIGNPTKKDPTKAVLH